MACGIALSDICNSSKYVFAMVMLFLKRTFSNCMTRDVPSAKSVAFWDYFFRAFPFSSPPPSLFTLVSYLSRLPFQPALSLPQRGEQ